MTTSPPAIRIRGDVIQFLVCHPLTVQSALPYRKGLVLTTLESTEYLHYILSPLVSPSVYWQVILSFKVNQFVVF